MANIKEVAKLANVSIATVSNVLHHPEKVSKETQEKVWKAIKKLNYSPNALARSLKVRKTKTVGVLISDISNPFFPTIIRGIEDVFNKNGYNVILCNTDEVFEKEEKYLSVLKSKQVDGIILSSTGVQGVSKKLEDLGLPIVFIDRIPQGVEGVLVTSDNEESAYEATMHLIQQGFSRIAIILGAMHLSTTKMRLQGYTKAMVESGYQIKKEYVVQGDSKFQGGKQAIERLWHLAEPPDAVFVTNSLMTLGALHYIKEQGIRVPEELALIGYHDQSDDLDFGKLFSPTITVIRQPTYEIGKEAALLLLEHLENGSEPSYQHKILSSELIIRESSILQRKGVR